MAFEEFKMAVTIFEERGCAGLRCGKCDEVLVAHEASQISQLHISPEDFKNLRKHVCPSKVEQQPEPEATQVEGDQPNGI